MELAKLIPSSAEELHHQLALLMVVSGAATFLTLMFGPTAPYGRYTRGGWGPLINSNIAWMGFFLAYHLAPNSKISPLAAVGIAIQIVGWFNVMQADRILTSLRKPGETGYKIPQGGPFRLVSAGNYASEILEWCGYALAARALPAAAFAFFAFCNLAPRAWRHHKWYLSKFEDYPKARRAVIPFVW
ncbi:steroid 5-alpha-reductase DET2 [Haematococcus lacustris]|uniref:Steroid 5-alpha-reductase DET2 n=1 Tax=Haematococcus lacustris TaxID=44745 RepID=A0A699YM66_HAELA|nr:steroid 5-alpha-reductase DET2 [Haematococcus lacustris]